MTAPHQPDVSDDLKPDAERLSADDAVAAIQRHQKLKPREDWRLTIAICNPGGLTAHQTVEVVGIQGGFDWTARQLIVQPAMPLSLLSPEQVADITKSVRAGGSWHAYEREKKSRAALTAAQAQIARLEAERDELKADRDKWYQEAAAQATSAIAADEARDEALARVAVLEKERDSMLRVRIMQGDVIATHVIAMQAAIIDAALLSPKEGLRWIFNTLRGPGFVPDVDEAKAMGGAQAWFDAKMAEHEAFRAANPGPSEATCATSPATQEPPAGAEGVL